MNYKKALLLPLLLCSVSLSGCAEEGIGLSSKPVTAPHEDSTAPQEEHGVQAGGTKTGQNGDEHQEEGVEQPLDDFGTPIIDTEEEVVTQTTVYFKLLFVQRNDENYICVSYDSDPFLSKYNFAYYTLNDSETRLTEYKKETIDDKEVYSINVKEEAETTNYTINFFNKKNVQYGKSDIVIQIKDKVHYTSFFAVSFTAIQVKFISLGYAISNAFKGFMQWLTNLFNPSNSSLRGI